MTTQNFPISSVSTSLVNWLALIPLLLIITLLVYLLFANKTTVFSVSDSQLSIKRTLYGRSIDLASLDIDNAQILDLTQDTNKDFRPAIRSNGIGLPNYQAGWFRLRNKEKALLFVTNRKNIVYIPTNEGYALMLSMDDTNGFLASIKR